VDGSSRDGCSILQFRRLRGNVNRHTSQTAAPSSRTLTGLVPYTRWGRLTQCQRRWLPVAALIAACETSGIGEATESRNTGDRGIRSRALQHRMRQAHAALLDICDGRLTAECTADVVERSRRDAGLSAKQVDTDGKCRVGSTSLDGPPDFQPSLFTGRQRLSRERYSMG
jgi:hypothetical protein